MKRLLQIVIIGCCMFLNSVLASSPLLSSAKALVCRSGPGISTSWENKTPLIKNSRNDTTFTFTEINLKQGTARLSGSGGTSVVLLVATPAGLSFIEVVPMGGVFLTTVFESSAAGDGLFPFADTRHNSIFAAPIVSQYHGTCEIHP